MRLRTSVGLCTLAAWLFAAPTAGQSIWNCLAKPIEPCVKRHGRLSSQNGIALKMWLIGTTRMLALDNEFEGLPPLVRRYLDMTSQDHSYIFGDFDICPLEPDTPRRIRRVCVIGGEKLVVQPLAGSRPSFRLLSTWQAASGARSNEAR